MSLHAALQPGLAERAAALHREALVWDNHGCMPFDNTQAFLPQLEKYRDAGVDVCMINIGDADFEVDVFARMAARIRHFVHAHPDRYLLIDTADDIVRAKAEGLLAVGLDIEGLHSIGEDIELIEFYRDIGVRWALMVYNRRNTVGSGCHDEVDEGLTAFGRRVIAEMDRVGMIKCCTHTGERTAMDVLTSTDKPTIFSHSNARAIRSHQRNITDQMIDACAATGGVVCLSGIGIFLGDNDVRPQTFVDHVDHVVQRVGPRHVGIGLDYVFDQAGLDDVLSSSSHTWPAGHSYAAGIKFLGPDALPQVTEELMRRGYGEDDIRGVLGANMLRVAREVWR